MLVFDLNIEIAFAILSGLLQALGYFVYVKKTLANEINPNPTSWLMWSYGTALVLILEWSHNASAAMLVLPAVCSISSMVVAFICSRRGTFKWPNETSDKIALYTDLTLTLTFIIIWILVSVQILDVGQQEVANISLLVIGATSSIITFVPLIRNTWGNPNDEHWIMWAIWTLAYGFLLLATILSDHWTWDLAIYPAINCCLHFTVALLATRNDHHQIRIIAAQELPTGRELS